MSFKRKSIINFNHIDESISEMKEKNQKHSTDFIIRSFGYTKRLTNIKKLDLASNIASVGLVATGTVAGVLTMNPIILGSISGSGMLLKTPTEAKNFKRKIEMRKFAFTSYEKVMNEIRSFMRGKEYDNTKFLNQLKMLGDINIDMCPLTDKFKSHYKKIFY